MLTADDASVLHVLKRAARNNRPLKTFTELADLHVAVNRQSRFRATLNRRYAGI